jgi:hypothetical protein
VPGINPHGPLASLAICMRLGETEEITQLPLTQEMITRLVFEAQVREMNVAELLAAPDCSENEDRFGQLVPNGRSGTAQVEDAPRTTVSSAAPMSWGPAHLTSHYST